MTDNNSSIALQKVSIQHLDPILNNVLVVGIIIGKQRPKTFFSSINGGQYETSKAVWNFTIRDSLRYYINVTFWGAVEPVFQANDKYKTGDVVQICNPQIIPRNINDRDEEYHPMVTSPYKLFMNEKSHIMTYPRDPAYLRLLRYPTKLTAAYVPLSNIHNTGASFKDCNIDLLGAVKGLGQIRTVTTKSNDMVQVRDVEIFDHTCPGLKITIWEPDVIQRSTTWKPRFTVLFFTDLKVEWSNFDRSYIAKFTGRSIVTENPISPEAELLGEYAKNAPIETFDIIEQVMDSLSSVGVKDIMTVKQVQDRINLRHQSQQEISKHFTALIFGFITDLDLDGLMKTLSIKCGKCKMTLASSKCENPQCPVVFGNDTVTPEIMFDIKVTITDHTGSLISCHLSGQTAEKVLNCTAKDFSTLSDDQKCVLKWKFLLQRCAVRVGVFFMIRQNPIISILNIESALIADVAKSLPVY